MNKKLANAHTYLQVRNHEKTRRICLMASKMTSKNLEELSELLNSENLAYKKCCNYVAECSDPTLKTKMGRYANNHKQRFDALLNYLNNQE